MTENIERELEELREFKRQHSKSKLDLAFEEIERALLKNPGARGFDHQMPVVAFRMLANALVLLREEMNEKL
jgi:hypothetical protein